MFHMDLGLGRMRKALSALKLDHPGGLSVQIAGTNGKGSTSTFLAAMLTASGVRTGLYTSPHFLSVRERILVDNGGLPDAAWLDAAEAVLAVSSDRAPSLRLTYFELLTVVAALLFARSGCRACVFEAGLGGAHDATSALSHHLTVFTPIGLDHMTILGPTIEDIARDKALAMRPGVPAVSADQKPRARAVLEAVAAQVGAPLYFARDLAAEAQADGHAWPDKPGLPGPHQADNLRLALAALHLLSVGHGPGRVRHSEPGPRPPELPETIEDPEVLARAAREAFIPGRFQIIPATGDQPSFVLDGAHNQPGLECLAQALESLRIKPVAAVFACLGDKDLAAMTPLARSLTGGPILVPGLDAPGRALDPAELAARLGGRAVPVAGVEEAFERVKGMRGTVLVCGSLYLLADVYRLRPHWLGRSPSSSPIAIPPDVG
jgi:dihydrofolate synthase/folylpolyglutamate synthase